MGSSSRGAKAADAAKSVGSNPYLRRLIEDEQLRDNIRVAFEAARDAYGRMSNGKAPAQKLMDDKKVHRDLRTAAESLREASDQLRGRHRQSKGLTPGRLLFAAVLGAILVLVLSEEARNAVLDRLFGAEEEFEYTSTTTSPDGESIGASA